ncbi:coth protein-domain-containing protein [Phascolomyces articulosus]|uniref:Coth protein-domain-containing protein n=1 Tax=Phascolomyces articulosus TaxID=60185 RepID=A0AAD5JX82_9FUNG|nr:coth protein-domain-containing protein [Phascolomyces articulosus]
MCLSDDEKLILLLLASSEAIISNGEEDVDNNNINYRVVGTFPKPEINDAIAVVIDETPYPLSPSPEDNLTYVGSGPIATQGYYYAHVKEGSTNEITSQEPFTRQPTQSDTDYEFYNRSRAYWDIPALPNLYNPLFHRKKSDLHLDGQIATVHFTGNSTELIDIHGNAMNEDAFVMVNMTFIRGQELHTFEDVKMELSGRSSRWNPKLSYSIKIPKEGGTSLYGYRRLKLRSLFSDPSYIREALVYHILRASGLATTDFSYVRVFINQKSAGFFGLIENFKNPWLNNEFANGDPDYQQGNLYQARLVADIFSPGGRISDLSYEGNNASHYKEGQYKIKEDPSDKNRSYEPLIGLIKFLENAPVDNITAWEQHFNMETVLRSMALEVVLGFSDGYSTLADNYYVYQNGLNAGQFIYIPSDVDLSVGSTMSKLSNMLSGDYRTYPGFLRRPLTRQFLRVPEFKERFEEILQQLASHLVNPSVLNPIIDGIADMIRQDVEWDQSLPRLGTTEIDILANQTSSIFDDKLSGIIDDAAIKDAFERPQPLPFDTAVNGPTGHISLTGVKEYIANSSRAILSFYGKQQENE